MYEKITSKVLTEIGGIKIGSKSFNLLTRRIAMVLEEIYGDTSYIETKAIVKLASEDNSNTYKVLHMLNYSTVKMWERGDQAVLKQIFKNMDMYCPTSTSFINTVAYFIVRNYERINNDTFKWEREKTYEE